ncbi:MAG: hypothetical protein ACOCRN_02160 [Spirochaetia bacterium]
MHPDHVTSMIDEFGYIRTEVSLDLIAPEFQALVNDAATRVPQVLDAEFAGLYLYGSVAAGRAVAGRSGLDLFLVLQAEPDDTVLSRIREFAGELESESSGLVREVSIESTWLDEVFNGPNRLARQVFLRHMCVCIAGDDIRDELPRFAPTWEVCASLNGDAPEVLGRLWREFERTHAEHDRRRIAGKIARKILYTGMSCIAAETGEWATGRADMASYLSLFYPAISADMEFLLHACEEQELALVGSLQRLRGLSRWISAESRRVLRGTGE